MLKPYKAIYAFLYVGITNKAITFGDYSKFLGSIHVACNLEELFDKTSYSDPYILNLTCSKCSKDGECIKCENCLLRANLFKSNIDDICLVNAILQHTKAKID